MAMQYIEERVETGWQTQPLPEPLLISVDQTAALFGVSKTIVWRLINRGELKSLKIEGRRLVSRDAIDEFIREKGVEHGEQSRP